MRRGHVFEVSYGGGTAHVLVVSDDELNVAQQAATCVLIYPRTDRPATMLDIPVEQPSSGLIVLGEFRTLSQARLGRDLGPVPERTMEAVEVGLRAVFGL